MRAPGRIALPVLLLAVWIAAVSPGGLTGFDLIGGFLAAAIGAILAVGWAPVRNASVKLLDAWNRWPGVAGAPSRPAPEPDEDPDPAGRAVAEVLRTLADELGVRRLAVWRVDRTADRVVAEFVAGPTPPDHRAAGSAVTWAVEQDSTLRVDPAPPWAEGAMAVAPVDARRALTAEWSTEGDPEPDRLRPGARILAALLTLVDREADARAERDRLHRVTGFLQGLSRAPDPAALPMTLAEAAVDLMDADGALVASWDDGGGEVLARVASDTGPEPGHRFDAGDGDLAHAGRTGATVRRTPGESAERPALATPRERWDRTVPYRVVVPLMDPDGATGGLVAAWGARPAREEGIRLMEALGPLLSLQLRQATDLVRFRARATVDALTGLPNRAAFDERMAEEDARWDRYRRPVALMVIDLDRFKAINDTHGHEAGDAVLREVAALVRDAVRDVDLPARYGGEEVVVLMPETMLRAAQDVAERVRSAVAGAEIVHEGTPIPVTASVGVAACPESVEEPRGLFDAADQALYRAKEAGRNRVVVG